MTAQFHENLILNGTKTSMAYCPDLPERHPRLLDRHAEGLPGDDGDVDCYSTACWREYIGSWEIKDGKLYLIRLQGRYRLRGNEPLFADWVSGILIIPRGERLQYVHNGFDSVFAEEVRIRIEKGVVASTRVVDNRTKKYTQWETDGHHWLGSNNQAPDDDE
jgi:hypothetical protein